MEYRTIPTTLGRAKLEQAALLQVPLELTLVEFGDGNGAEYLPTGQETALKRKVYEAAPNMLADAAESETWVELHAVLPFDVGGWWLREFIVRDAAGDAIFIGNLPESFKPIGSTGAIKDIAFELVFDILSPDSVTLKVDPSKVLATRKYVDDYVAQELAKLDAKQSARVATTAPVALSGLLSVDGVQLVAGDRVLVKNQANGAQNGVYIAASGAWARAADADASIEVTPGMLVPVEQGATNADSVWQLVTDAPINLGVTALAFEVAAGPTGLAVGTYRSITVDKRGRVVGGTNPTTLAGFGITDGLSCRVTPTTEDAAVSWNTLVAPGLHPNVILGSNPDGPGVDLYFYCRTYVRIPVDGNGSGALQQFAEPYGTPTSSGRMYWRGLNGTTWTPWNKVIGTDDHADQVAAEAGVSTSHWMSPLRVFQAIAKKVVQATETVLGIAKIATQTQTVAGTDDATIVTPKKMRYGFAMSFSASSGYLLFPTWLGSALLQYGRATLAADTETTFTWPLAWPEACYALGGGVLTAGNRDQDGVVAQFRALTQTSLVINRQDIYTAATGTRDIFVLAVGK